VKQFYQELDRGAGPSPERSGDLGFLTARPWDPIGIFENQTHKMLQEKGVPEATVLTGDVFHLLGNQNIANKKVDNFSEYKQQYPEYGYVFLGDSGQGDVMAAQKMLAMDKTESVRGAFIHDVVNTPQAKRDEYGSRASSSSTPTLEPPPRRSTRV
jgi:phosphatidate phosphatase APP1